MFNGTHEILSTVLEKISKVKIPGWAGAVGGVLLLMAIEALPTPPLAHLGVEVPPVAVLLEILEPITIEGLPEWLENSELSHSISS